MSWEPLSKSLGSVIDDRLSSPLISGFVISWSVINWKFLVVLFSNNTVSTTFDLASKLYETKLDWWGWNAAAPIAASLTYVYLLPPLSRKVTKKWRENQKLVEDDRRAVEDMQLLDIGTSRKLRNENYKLRVQLDELSTERDQAIEDAKLAVKNQRAAEFQRAASEEETASAKARAVELKSKLDEVTEQREAANKRAETFQLIASAAAPLLNPDDLLASVVKKNSRIAAKLKIDEIKVLGVMSTSEDATPASIARLLDMDSAQVTSVLANLMPMGLVESKNARTGVVSGYRLSKKGADAALAVRAFRQVVNGFLAEKETSK